MQLRSMQNKESIFKKESIGKIVKKRNFSTVRGTPNPKNLNKFVDLFNELLADYGTELRENLFEGMDDFNDENY